MVQLRRIERASKFRRICGLGLLALALCISATSASWSQDQSEVVGKAFALMGSKTPTDREDGLSMLANAADAGNPAAQYYLAQLYQQGVMVQRNSELAERLYRQAAQAGYSQADYKLGLLLENSGSAEDLTEAAGHYRVAAQAGLPHAQYMLASAFYEGRGVEEDFFEAQLWLKKAAAADFTPAMVALGLAHLDGDRGVKRDTCRALELFLAAGAKGDARAKDAAGVLLGLGREYMSKRLRNRPYTCKITHDEDRALELFRSAADAGFDLAKLHLAQYYAGKLNLVRRWAECDSQTECRRTHEAARSWAEQASRSSDESLLSTAGELLQRLRTDRPDRAQLPNFDNPGDSDSFWNSEQGWGWIAAGTVLAIILFHGDEASDSAAGSENYNSDPWGWRERDYLNPCPEQPSCLAYINE